MESDKGMFLAALDTVRSAALTPTEHLLLERFLDLAEDPECAARYLLQKVKENPNRSVEASLGEVKEDWRQLVTKSTKREAIPLPLQCLLKRRDVQNCCCMVNHRERLDVNATFDVEPTWIIPPSTFDDNELAYESPLSSLLEAFLTPDKVRWLRDMLEGCTEQKNALKNLLLLSPSVQSAFRDGHIEITRGSECTDLTLSNGDPLNGNVHMFKIFTQDPSLYPLPSEELLRIHSKIATALHLFFVEERISIGWPRSPYISLSKTACQYIRRCWHFVPKPIRVRCYLLLLKVNERLYPHQASALAQQLPLGLYMKQCYRTRYNEGMALQIVEQRTSIHAPLYVDTFEHEGKLMLVMTWIKGNQLNEVFHRLSYQERAQLSADLCSAIKQLRTIPNNTSHRFANVLGGPLLDVRIPDQPDVAYGPFNKVTDFHNSLIHTHIASSTEEAVAPIYSRKYRSFFSHADLNPYNIMIDRGKLSGIVDWECAGYYPEYWEFTKGIYCVENSPEREKIIRDAFPDDNYDEELAAEKLLWKETPPWV
ncbi:serine/threonine protein kinase [Nannizzia gypsea CBS 118893]|uniref:Serine/threonine protein kinase n=1 Tax=Arthroderma gypseum (strain ATCC MYA-4604 / CBS 118893) TaxID=535722 RepID=E4USP2_ARTGP|nr:serine/threonine protein kinase [Nannizzia gypsea CBS 118893]EFR00557.1 serine/threonine protein kinase [Nannizzia gypsea CBS 118893]